MKNIKTNILEYQKQLISSKNVYDSTLKELNKTYNPNGEVYKQLKQKANDLYVDQVKTAKDKCQKSVMDSLAVAKNTIMKSISVKPSAELISLLSVMDVSKMSDMEKQILLDSYKGNYIDQKLLHEKMGMKFESSIEEVSQEIERFGNSIQKFFDTYNGSTLDKTSYHNALILNGNYVDTMAETISEVIGQYQSGTEGNGTGE